eukprot:scaffold176669_cov28-Tisochrysis_lutea.AAC.1
MDTADDQHPMAFGPPFGLGLVSTLPSCVLAPARCAVLLDHSVPPILARRSVPCSPHRLAGGNVQRSATMCYVKENGHPRAPSSEPHTPVVISPAFPTPDELRPPPRSPLPARSHS